MGTPPDESVDDLTLLTRDLVVAAVLLVAAYPAIVALGRWLWGQDDLAELFVVMTAVWTAIAGPLLAAGLQTLRRLGKQRYPTFEPWGLLRAMRFGGGALVGYFAFGIFGVLIAVPLMAVAAGSFAVSWVRPTDDDRLLTQLVGGTVPFLVFVGGLIVAPRPLVGGIVLTMALSGVLRLWMFRQVALAES
ncbi:MAG: hypothetical protein AAGC53_05650 [Actinomycetota bacterium]